MEEIAKIITIKDESPRVKAAVLLGALCGLRMGEVRGLHWEDIDRVHGQLSIRHNYVDDREGIKAPKCGSKREVALPEEVYTVIESCRIGAPEGGPFVIWNEKSLTRPADKNALERGFRRVLLKIGIDEDARKRRNLVFHGLRHGFVSMTRASGLPDFIVQRLAGHKSSAMMERYSHAENLVDFVETKARIDGQIQAAAGKLLMKQA